MNSLEWKKFAEENICMTRRDYLNSTLLASGSLLLGGATPMDLIAKDDWDGYGGVGDYASSNGNTFEVMAEAHRTIRDNASENLPANVIDTGEEFDCVVVGGGISGLAAALFFKRQAALRRTCLVLENHRIFGGEARRSEFLVEGRRLVAHQGSAMFFPPLAGTFLADFYDSIGVDSRSFEYQAWTGREPEIPLGRTSYMQGGANSGFFFGAKLASE
jgi:spermidine dehydrogenase